MLFTDLSLFITKDTNQKINVGLILLVDLVDCGAEGFIQVNWLL